MTSKKIALVLSGGGAKGAFQMGALNYIKEKTNSDSRFKGLDYSIISGVSVGALNGAMVSMEKLDELENFWDTITNEDIYKGNPELKFSISMLFKLIMKKKSILSNDPLLQKLRSHVSLAEIKKDFRFGSVSLTTGRYSQFYHSEFTDDLQLQNAILGSTAMPVFWPPVEEVKTKEEVFTEMVDGGIRNISPLGDVIDDDPDMIIIINCSYPKLGIEMKNDSILQITKRSLLDIAMNEIFISDIEEFLRLNELVKQAAEMNCNGLKKVSMDYSSGTLRINKGDKNYKKYDNIIIQPTEDLGDPLDFNQSSIQTRKELGYIQAQQAFEQFFIDYPNYSFMF
jgi:NTE family protein